MHLQRRAGPQGVLSYILVFLVLTLDPTGLRCCSFLLVPLCASPGRYQNLSDAEEAKKLRDARRFAKGLFYNVRGPCLRRFIVRDDFSPFFESKDSADAAFAYFDKVWPWRCDGVVVCLLCGVWWGSCRRLALSACGTCIVQARRQYLLDACAVCATCLCAGQ